MEEEEAGPWVKCGRPGPWLCMQRAADLWVCLQSVWGGLYLWSWCGFFRKLLAEQEGAGLERRFGASCSTAVPRLQTLPVPALSCRQACSPSLSLRVTTPSSKLEGARVVRGAPAARGCAQSCQNFEDTHPLVPESPLQPSETSLAFECPDHTHLLTAQPVSLEDP